MYNTLLIISYLGTAFKGSQIQKDLPTAQKLIQNKLSIIYGKPIKVRPCSRLDASVHALMWAVNFKDEEQKLEPDHLRYSLNRLLDNTMYVKDAMLVPEDFDSRYDVYEKTYLYRINNGEKNPITSFLEWTPIFKPDINKLQEALNLYLGTHDFSSFTSEKDDNPHKTISAISLSQKDDIISIRITGHSFLKYQVRFMVGAAYEVSASRLDINEIKERLNSTKFSVLKYKAPGEGLYLENIKYDLERSKNVKS